MIYEDVTFIDLAPFGRLPLVLEAVRSFSFPFEPYDMALLQLQFSTHSVFVRVEIDFDTIACSADRPSASEFGDWVEVSTGFGDSLIGLTVNRVWAMTNDRGYPDGLQFEFQESSGIRRIQCWGLASMLDLTELESRAVD